MSAELAETEAILEAARMAVRRATIDNLFILMFAAGLLAASVAFLIKTHNGCVGGRTRKRKYIWRTVRL